LPYVRIDHVTEAMVFLEQVCKAMDKNIQWKCAECGKNIWYKIKFDDLGPKKVIQRTRRDANYCSQACRQRAFRKRKRVTDRVSDTTAQP
jgi:hypothetical protein